MDRLHIAVEKARAQRMAKEARRDSSETSEAAEVRTAPPAETLPERREAPAAPPAPTLEPPREEAPALVVGRQTVDPAAVDALWAGLTPLDMPAKRRQKPNPAMESAYRALRTRMLQQMRRNGWRRVAIVSPDPGDGKTTVAAHVGEGMTRQFDTRTVMLDLDLRRAGLSRLMRPKNLSHGMGAVLSGDRPFARHALKLGTNVAYGLNESPVNDASEILQSQSTVEILDMIDRDFDPGMVVVDMPPLLLQEDNVAFLENVDCALIVAAAERTPMSRIDSAERQVAELTNVMGIVLNKCRYPERTNEYAYGT